MAGELECDLRRVAEWSELCLVSFNSSKTKLLSINKFRDLTDFKIEFQTLLVLTSLLGRIVLHTAVMLLLCPSSTDSFMVVI